MLVDFLRKAFYVLRINPKIITNFVKDEKIIVNDIEYNSALSQLNKLNPDIGKSAVTLNKIDKIADVHIVIPAYNVEKYIEACIDSVLYPPKKTSPIILPLLMTDQKTARKVFCKNTKISLG